MRLFTNARRCALLSLVCAALAGCAAPTAAQARPQSDEDSIIAARQYASLYGTRVIVLPVLMYTPETRIGIGAGAMLSRRRPGSRPATLNALVLLTQRHQQIVELGANTYTPGDLHRYSVGGVFRKFPTTFYGVGNHTGPADEEAYTPRTAGLRVGVERRLRGPVRGSLAYDFTTMRLIDVEAGGALARRAVPGAQGGDVSGLRAAVFRDTRDNGYSAGRGGLHTLRVAGYAPAFGSEYEFETLEIDLRRYVPIHTDHVLAFQADARFTSSGTPFHMMSTLGGADLLRGYPAGRFRDRHRIAAQAEYRAIVWRGFGAAVFGGTGAVAGDVSDFGLGGLHHAAGFGLRYRLDPQERMTVRLDIGWGRNTSGVYLTVNEAF